MSPVADKLRSVLQDVNWARAGLGLALLQDREERQPGQVPQGGQGRNEHEGTEALYYYWTRALLFGYRRVDNKQVTFIS